MVKLPQDIVKSLAENQYKWLITGVAGFIGSNLLEVLLKHNQHIIGIDNFSTGKKENLFDVKKNVDKTQWKNFQFFEFNIEEYDKCNEITKDIDFILHQAALGSVPRSISDPILSNNANVNGFLNIINSAKDNNVKSFVYAASSSTYGDHLSLPKTEDKIGKPLSPYAVSKYVNELYAHVFSINYEFHSIGLRYFNVFGKRQDPDGAYAAVIPKWIKAIIENNEIFIYGDGKNSRDFCFIDNAIQANIIAALADKIKQHEVYNVAFGGRTALNELADKIFNIASSKIHGLTLKKIYKEPRKGDVLHSQADITKIKNNLKYIPTHDINHGLEKTVSWFIERRDQL